MSAVGPKTVVDMGSLRLAVLASGNQAQWVVQFALRLGVQGIDLFLPLIAPYRFPSLFKLEDDPRVKIVVSGDSFGKAAGKLGGRVKSSDSVFIRAGDDRAFLSGKGGLFLKGAFATAFLYEHQLKLEGDAGAILLQGGLELVGTALEPEEFLEKVLATHGYLVDGSVRTIETAAEGKFFSQLVADHLPPGWDPMAAFEVLDFGPWLEIKNINSSFRSFGEYKSRWGGDRKAALLHTIGQRGQILRIVVEFIDLRTKQGDEIQKILSEVKERFEHDGRSIDLKELHSIAERLDVENYLNNLYLERTDLWPFLWPGLSDGDQRNESERMRYENQKVKEAVAEFRSLAARHPRAFSPEP